MSARRGGEGGGGGDDEVRGKLHAKGPPCVIRDLGGRKNAPPARALFSSLGR